LRAIQCSMSTPNRKSKVKEVMSKMFKAKKPENEAVKISEITPVKRQSRNGRAYSQKKIVKS
jgi:hypothetical protein